MLYKDKFGVFWEEKEVVKLPKSKIDELEIMQIAFDYNNLFY